MRLVSARPLLPLLALLLVTACDDGSGQGTQFYDRTIQPIFNGSCMSGTSPCHRADPADPFSFAAGNLDLSSFENTKRRPDVLRTYGAFPVPFLLMKAVGPSDSLNINYPRDPFFFPSEVAHSGGRVLEV